MTWTAATPSCAHEQDVLDLVATEQWPDRATPALVAHASACDVCRDVAMAAVAMVDLRDAAPAPALPDARLVWYRTQVRARADAAQRAARPMLIAQAVAVTCVLGLGLTWLTSGAAGLAGWWQWLASVPGSLAVWTPADQTSSPALVRYVGLGLLGLVVAGLIAYSIVELADDRPLKSTGGRRD
jgi:hypothetical protein